ncbi:hypothetical protein H5410_018953 [Solanum commersonii]|uniref:Uncharacterized protein n=1 Tax=Solanum commersonii TaxID=4109 RepID=A0A9J6A3L5_SOLCO|nr:hypothetical protein H5410_018953 [Solanum commersonii]
MEDMNVDLLFHHGGKWTLKPHLLYDERYVHSLRAFNSNHLNLIDIKEVFENNLGFVLVKQVLVKGPSGNLFLVQDSDGIRILQELLTAFRVVHYDFDELELIKMQKNKEVNANLSPVYKLQTFKQEHNCEEALHNPRATTNTLSHYFKSKVQNNPKYALKDMKQDLMDNFNLNTNDSKLKRDKRMALQKMQGKMKKLMWWAAWCTYEEDFKDQLNALGALSRKATKDLIIISSILDSWILVPRGKPILKMLEEIRVKLMNKLRKKEKRRKHGTFITNTVLSVWNYSLPTVRLPTYASLSLIGTWASEEGCISSLKRKRGRTEEEEQDEEVFDVNSSAPQLTLEGFESDISAPRQRQYEPFVLLRELESDLF